MTVRERVLASRLIEKIENNSDYAKQIGLSYMVVKESCDSKSESAREGRKSV